MIKFLSGSTSSKASEIQNCSEKAYHLIEECFKDLNKHNLCDTHVHLVGIEHHNSGCYVHPHYRSWWHPFNFFRYRLFMYASGVTPCTQQKDQRYLERLLELSTSFPFNAHQMVYLLAFDEHYSEHGECDKTYSVMHTSNDYVFSTCCHYPHLFVPVFSIHPYRKDALQELERCANLFKKWETLSQKKAHKLIKWLPNTMGIDPSSPLCQQFYTLMKEFEFVLLSHTGSENALYTKRGYNTLGNPQLLKRALNSGVKVIMAHGGGVGKNRDLENPKSEKKHNSALALRMLKEPHYNTLLFSDLSAMTLINHLIFYKIDPLTPLLNDRSLHSRLLYGTDYPLPSCKILTNLWLLKQHKLIQKEMVPILREIFYYNPSLFNLVLMRCLKDPVTGNTFSPSIFETNPNLFYD